MKGASTPTLLDYVKIYDNAIDLKLCDELVNEFENDWTNQVSTGANVYRLKTDTGRKLYKKFTEIDFRLVPRWHQKYGHILKPLMIEYTNKYYDDIGYPTHLRPPVFGYEPYRIKKYLPHSGISDRIDEHTDASNLGLCKRFLSLFWYLNDVEEGGETRFTGLNYHVKPKKGKLLVFPPMWMFPHEGCPVITGQKYLLHSYLHFSPKNVTNFNVMTELYPLKSGAIQKDK